MKLATFSLITLVSSGCTLDVDSRPLGIDWSSGITPYGEVGPTGETVAPTATAELNEAPGETIWQRRIGASGWDVGDGVVHLSGGDVVTVGTFAGTVDFGCGPVAATGACDAYLVRYDATGACVWNKQLAGATAYDCVVGYDVAVGANDVLLVAGAFMGDANVGSDTLSSAGGGFDGLVAQYTPTGSYQWSRALGGAGEDFAFGVAAGAQGLVYVAGTFEQSADFGGGSITAAGTWDAFLASYDSTGTHQWSRADGGAGDDGYNDATVDSTGDVIAVGYFEGTATFAGNQHTSAGSYDIALTSFSSGGVAESSRRVGGTGYDSGRGVATDSADSIIMTGAVGSSLFVVSYAKAGSTNWVKTITPASGTSSADAVAIDADDNVFVAGRFTDTINLGGTDLTAVGSTDVFAVKFSSQGSHTWSVGYGGGGPAGGYGISVGTADVVVTGYFQQSIDLGDATETSAGGYDAMLVSVAR